ncbi:ATP-grasp domain-containing protein [Thermodesulfobacteriota bacterium]
MKKKVLIAGIGGASLGTELLKCLKLADKYNIFGCDISEFAFGHYQSGFEKTFLADPNNYVNSIIDICLRAGIEYVIPGAEEPMVLLAESANSFTNNGIRLVTNSTEIIKSFSNKTTTFAILSGLGFRVPLTREISHKKDVYDFDFPAVIKPARGSGGSFFVFLASNIMEAELYIDYLFANGKHCIIQEYIPEDDGEFTVGVLSLPNFEIVSSIALKRLFNCKLSISSKVNAGIISSGNSQGLIDDFPEIRKTAENIASSIRSTGPINVQGRLKDGVFIPFEINPRFSASCFLRAIAGVNEVDIYLNYLINRSVEVPKEISYGYYLRSFSEIFVQKKDVLTND